MIDLNITPEEIEAAHRRRLDIRAQIRAQNEMRPRCSGCGCDMPVFSADDVVTAEQMAEPGYDWLAHEDFRPGDLLCFWCTVEIAAIGYQYQWGRA